MNEQSKAKTIAAGTRVVGKATKAAAELLSAMHKQGRTGADMPVILSRFYEKIGGQDAYADMMGEQFLKAQGKDLTEQEKLSWEASPKLVKDWFELTARYIDRADQNKSLDVSAMEESDLENILVGVGTRAVLEDPAIRKAVIYSALDVEKFRREIFLTIAATDKNLVDYLLRENGIITLEQAQAAAEESDTVSPGAAGTNELRSSPSEEPEYDPAEDEFK